MHRMPEDTAVSLLMDVLTARMWSHTNICAAATAKYTRKGARLLQLKRASKRFSRTIGGSPRKVTR